MFTARNHKTIDIRLTLVTKEDNGKLNKKQIKLHKVKNVITWIRNSRHRINSILDRAEERLTELKETSEEIIHNVLYRKQG